MFGAVIVADAAAIIDRVGTFAATGSLLGVIVTSLFLIGLAEWHDRTILRTGYDSAAVLVVYAGGLVLLYSVHETS